MAETLLIASPADIIAGNYYALPHEEHYMTDLLEKIEIARNNLSVHIKEAMEQSSETWHDNAPAEALFGELKQIDQQEAGLIIASRRLTVVEYPPEDTPFVTLGSRVRYTVAGKEFEMDISGNLPFSIEKHTDVEAGSIVAPLPQALLGKEKDAELDIDINNRTLHLGVIAIDQVAQRRAHSQIGGA